MADFPYAEELNYWKTGRAEADTWLDKAEDAIARFGGEVVRRATAREYGREAMLLEFVFGEDRFRAVWPVLESKTGDTRAARRQAATMLYHEVKARAVRFAIYGARHAFIDMLLTTGGQTVSDLVACGASDRLPKLLTAGGAS